MRKTVLRKIFVIFSIAFLFETTVAQNGNNLAAHLRQILIHGYEESFLRAYMQPFTTAFGTATAGALFHRAYTKNFPRLDVGFSAVYMNIPDEVKYFSNQGEQVPSFFGPSRSISNGVPGSGLGSFNLSQIQLNLGLFGNFELLIRGLNFPKIEEVGNIELIGIGMKYEMSDLISLPRFPINMSVQAIYQTFGVGDWLDAGTFGMNLQVSKQINVLPFDIYAGMGFEASSFKIHTDEIPDIGENGIGDVSIDGENNLRINFGISMTLTILNIHADYNYGKYNSFAGGVMVVF